MKEAEKERTITLPMNELCAIVETFLTPNHPVYQFVFKHSQQQILEGFGLSDREEDV